MSEHHPQHEPPVTGPSPNPAEVNPGGPGRWRGRVGILKPLAIRDFRLLWVAMTVSMIGDGIYFVAIAWKVYEIENAPSALSVVGLAFSLPMLVFLIFGGVISDRFDRRKVMIVSDAIRGVAIGLIGLLSVLGVIELWHIYILVAFYGTGEALFAPAFGAIVPELVPRDLLVEANSLDHFVRPFALRLVGPAVGGVMVALIGAGPAFLVDAASFAFSVLALSLMAYRRSGTRSELDRHSVIKDVKEGLAFVRAHAWLWGTLLSAGIGLLFFIGPFEVLIPFLVKNKLDGSSTDLGWIFTAGGVGAIAAAITMGQVGLPRRHIRFLYLNWTVGVLLVGMLALATETWHMMVMSAFLWAFFTNGIIVWGTLMHKLVPGELLGRVTSLDWLVSFSLVPLSYALTGQIAEKFGAEETLLWGGVIASLATIICLFIPGMRDTERNGALDEHPGPDEQREGEAEEVLTG